MPALSPAPAAVSPRVWAWPGYACLGAALAAQLIAPGLVHQLRYVPLLASLIVLGVPHGAVDHLVPGWVDPRPGPRARRRRLIRLIVAYLAVTLAGVAVWLTDPRVALGLFLVAAVLHWGSADLVWAPRPPRPAAFIAARGAIPVLWPAVVWPRAYASALQSLLAPFGPGITVAPLMGGSRALVAGLILATTLAGAGRGWRGRLELGGLIVVFTVVDPVFAVGAYFIAWHSWRHIVRLAAVSPEAGTRLRAGRPGAAVRVILRASVPCSVVAVAGIAALAVALSVGPTAAAQVTAPALALIAALTVPHALLVAWLDRQVMPAAPPRPTPAPGFYRHRVDRFGSSSKVEGVVMERIPCRRRLHRAPRSGRPVPGAGTATGRVS